MKDAHNQAIRQPGPIDTLDDQDVKVKITKAADRHVRLAVLLTAIYANQPSVQTTAEQVVIGGLTSKKVK